MFLANPFSSRIMSLSVGVQDTAVESACPHPFDVLLRYACDAVSFDLFQWSACAIELAHTAVAAEMIAVFAPSTFPANCQ